ncbi:MAG: hypothetical protein ABEK29_01495, partial [Bradymonadaceae bacterium]
MLDSHSQAASSSTLVETRGLYVFAVATRRSLADGAIGEDEEPIELVEHGDRVAIASPIDLGERGATPRSRTVSILFR